MHLLSDHYIFVSYAHADEARVRPIINTLEENGFDVWHDSLDNLQPGSRWSKEIVDAIERSTVFLAFFSKSYMKSKHCFSEIQCASNADCQIQSIYLEQVRLSDEIMGMGVSRYQNLEQFRYLKDEDFYMALFKMQGMEDCRHIYNPYILPKTSFMTVLKRRLKRRAQKNKKKLIKLGIGLLVLLGLGTAAVIKGPDLIDQAKESIRSIFSSSTAPVEEDKGTLIVAEADWTEAAGSEMSSMEFEESIPAFADHSLFSFVAEKDGTYYLVLSELKVSNPLNVTVSEKSGDVVDTIFNMETGSVLLLKDLAAGKTYQVEVVPSEETNRAVNYTMTLVQPKEEPVISGNTRLTDSLHYWNQVNTYRFTAPSEGCYILSFSDPSAELYYEILNEAGDTIVWDYIRDNDYNRAITGSFAADENYQIRISCGDGPAEYTMSLQMPGEVQDLSDYSAITDTMNCEGEQKIYRFVTGKAGAYCFGFDEMMADFRMQITIIDPYGFIAMDETLGSKENHPVNLEEEREYQIRITQRDGLGSYTLRVHTPTEVRNVKANSKTRDEMTYASQTNIYSFKAKASKDKVYYVHISEISDEQEFYLRVMDEFGHEIESTRYVAEGCTFPVDETVMVNVEVIQSKGLGTYRLDIETQKKEE